MSIEAFPPQTYTVYMYVKMHLYWPTVAISPVYTSQSPVLDCGCVISQAWLPHKDRYYRGFLQISNHSTTHFNRMLINI